MLSPTIIILVSVAVATLFAAFGILARRGASKNLDDFIIFRNRTGSIAATCSIVACLTGSWILYSVPEAAATYGLASIFGYAIGQGLPMLLLVPIGARVRREFPGGRSLSDYVAARFGLNAARFVLGFMFVYMFVFLCAELSAVGGAFQTVAGFPAWLTALAVMLFTLVYAVYGGLPSSIVTDVLQFVVILPLLLLVLVASFGSTGGIDTAAAAKSPALAGLLDPLSWTGIQFGIVLIIGVTASNLFHQGFWQRIYTCTSERVMRRAFGIAGVLTIVMIGLAGVFGLIAATNGLIGDGQAAQSIFLILKTLAPAFLLITLVLALSLTMSSSDTLLNALCSIIMLHKASRPHDEKKALFMARSVTALLGGVAVFVAAQGLSVLYLFLIVDLLAAATVFPVIAGLYLKRYGNRGLRVACVSGLVAGVPFFPGPDYTSVITASWWPGSALSGDTLCLLSFGLAFGVSLVAVLIADRAGTSPEKA